MQLLHKTQQHCKFSFEVSIMSMETSLFISLSIVYSYCLLISPTFSSKDGNQTDRLSLLAFRNEITQDPFGTLSSWNDSLHFCKWKGVTCGRRHRRVTILDLQSQRLSGSISPHIGNLTFLKKLDLGNNSFSGEIPQQVGRLFRLKSLALRNNSLEGEIPVNISCCLNLINLYLSNNKLVGRIPSELGSLTKLNRLFLFVNYLSGNIPSSLGNLSSLGTLVLRENSLGGSIPSDLGKLKSLSGIDLNFNNLSGTIPPSIYNLSLISVFSVAGNQLRGNLPFDIGLNYPNLYFLSVSMNSFSGPIPASFSNSSGPSVLSFDSNNFVGPVPTNFGSLQSLRWLALHLNNLGSGDDADDDLSFLTSLTNCSNLEDLMINNNFFGGMLPNSIANLSTKLTKLTLDRNQIYGSIPTGIQDLVGLSMLGMADNLFTGSIPTGIGKLQNLREISLKGNKLVGQIPSSFGNLTQLNELVLSKNELSGRIPPSLGNCSKLLSLDLSQNKLNGTIPQQVIGLSSLSVVLNLGNNSLSGSLPWEVGNLKTLMVLVLSGNRLSGEIPSTLGECSSLVYLLMDGNFFQGNVPPSLSLLKGLQYTSLSRNNLSGPIPKGLETITMKILDLSFNNFEGEVPREGIFKNTSGISLEGNSKLCGGIPQLQLPNCPLKLSNKPRKSLSFKIIILIAVGILFLELLVSFSLILYWRNKSKKKPSRASNFDNQSLERISYNELLKATDGFSSFNLLGTGSFGSVYKAILRQDEKPVAVKVLNLQRRGANKSFMAECDALRNVRHRNLLKILTACSSTDFQGNEFKALVFEFMPNGSLEDWLHPINAEDQSPLRNLSFEQRLSIAIDVASALDYLHHQCETPLVHRDLKPSNVLLDDYLTAHVGDFGLAKFLIKSSSGSGQNEQTNSAAIKGSIGYVAPEYGMGSKVSTQGDVYSYGILLLEMITGRRPTDDIFKDGLNLHSFCRTSLSTDEILEIVDSRLLSEIVGDASDETNHSSNVRNSSGYTRREKLQECLGSTIRIGLACSAELPVDRMDLHDVVVELRVLKDLFLGVETHG